MVKISVKGELWGKKRDGENFYKGRAVGKKWWGKKRGGGGRFLPKASWILYIQR